MGRRRLPRCKCCGNPIQGTKVSIVFFAREGDTFTDGHLPEEMINTINDMYCVPCALIFRKILMINQKGGP